MNGQLFVAAYFAAVSVGTVSAVDLPTMGWSSWNTYRVNISEDLIKRQADALVDGGFAAVGYKYVNIDFGMWCMMASPLLIGCDLTTIKPETMNRSKHAETLSICGQ